MGFAQALKLVLELEGGFEDNRLDPGGETVAGITRASYEEFCRLTGARGAERFPGLSQSEIAAFYRWYWDSQRVYDAESGGRRALLEMVPEPADAALFQWAVNSGWGVAVRGLQAALLVAPDGVVGPVTMRALRAFNGRGEELKTRILAAQMMHLGDSHGPQWPFFEGIANRVIRTEKTL